MESTVALARFLTRRTLQAVPLLFGLVTLIFFLTRLLPGDPASLLVSPAISPAAADRLRTEFGLTRPLAEQYFLWLRGVFSGDLGISFSHGEPVARVLLRFFPNTLLLGSAAFILELLIAVSLTAASLRRPGSALDKCISRGSLVVYALPSFWIGLLLLLLFSYQLHLLPSSQMYSLDSDAGSLTDLLRHLLLPALTAALPGAASLIRYLRTSIEETRRQDFVLAAQSFGLKASTVFRAYLLPNSAGPFIAQAGMEIGVLFSGVVVTETLFAWPGMGRLLILAVLARDYPLILGCTILSGVAVILGNLLADVIQALMDPRLSLKS